MTIVSTKYGAVAVLDKASYIKVSDDGEMIAYYSKGNDRIISKVDIEIAKRFLEKNRETFTSIKTFNGKIYANVNKVVAVDDNKIEFENNVYEQYKLDANDISYLVMKMKETKCNETEENVNTL